MSKKYFIPPDYEFNDEFLEEWKKPGHFIQEINKCPYTENEMEIETPIAHQAEIAKLKLDIYRLHETILDCWESLQVKPRQKSPWLSTRLRDEELLENQEELINQLREILEPEALKIINLRD